MRAEKENVEGAHPFVGGEPQKNNCLTFHELLGIFNTVDGSEIRPTTWNVKKPYK